MNKIWKTLILVALCTSIVNLLISVSRGNVREEMEAELLTREQVFVERVKLKVNELRIAFGSDPVTITNLEQLAEAFGRNERYDRGFDSA